MATDPNLEKQLVMLDQEAESALTDHIALLIETGGEPAPAEPDDLAVYSLECQRRTLAS